MLCSLCGSGLSVFFDLEIDELWIQYGSSKDKRWIPIHSYAHLLGEKMCRALPFWYAITGSDTTSQFAGHGKKSAWKTWSVLPELTDVFIRLSDLSEITNEDKQSIERFVCVLYERGSKFSSVNDARRYLFAAMSRNIENCPPTSAALEQHIKRSQLQAAYWTQCLETHVPEIDVTNWGWKRDKNTATELVFTTKIS